MDVPVRSNFGSRIGAGVDADVGLAFGSSDAVAVTVAFGAGVDLSVAVVANMLSCLVL